MYIRKIQEQGNPEAGKGKDWQICLSKKFCMAKGKKIRKMINWMKVFITQMTKYQFILNSFS